MGRDEIRAPLKTPSWEAISQTDLIKELSFVCDESYTVPSPSYTQTLYTLSCLLEVAV